MKTFESYFLAINKWLLIIMLAVMSLIIFANVILRYTTSISIEWAEEVARHLMIWLTFVGCGPVLRYGGHIAVENLQDALPRKVAIALRVLIALLVLGLFAFLAWFGLEYMDRTCHTNFYCHHLCWLAHWCCNDLNPLAVNRKRLRAHQNFSFRCSL